jgi:hypothetical protein
MIYLVNAYDGNGRAMEDEALSVVHTDRALADAHFDWLVAGGWPAKLISVS